MHSELIVKGAVAMVFAALITTSLGNSYLEEGERAFHLSAVSVFAKSTINLELIAMLWSSFECVALHSDDPTIL